MGRHLPKLHEPPLLRNDDYTELVNSSSGDDSAQDLLEDGAEWYPDEATPVNLEIGLAKYKLKKVVQATYEVVRNSR